MTQSTYRSPRAVNAGVVSLAAAVAILAAKTAAWLITGSTALLADAAESVVNVLAAAVVTYSLVVAARPPDADHPYGHGKAEVLSAMLEGGLIMLAAAAIALESARRLVFGFELGHLSTGIWISAVAGVANLCLGLYLLRAGRRNDSAALRADGVHVLTDTVTTAGGIAALLVVQWTGALWVDPAVAVLVAANILWAGTRVVRNAVQGLLDEADFDLLERIAGVVQAVKRPDWCEIHQLRAWASGARRHVDLHVVVPRYFSMEEAHASADLLERALLDEMPQGDAVLHLDPCRPIHCAACSMPDCALRSAAQTRTPTLDVDELTRDGVV